MALTLRPAQLACLEAASGRVTALGERQDVLDDSVAPAD
jgi:hypothetical protein